MSQFIISANYRDRQSPNKWLVRRQDEPLSKAIEVASLKATGVRFTGSNLSESGFGCSIVGVADEVQYTLPQPKLTPLRFSGSSFKTEDHERVDEVKSLILSDDGSALAVL